MPYRKISSLLFLALLLSCATSENDIPIPVPKADLTIFFVNDQHGRINNFAKVKNIVDEAKAEGNALLVCAGDVFAGNPIVDQFSEQGYPMIDIMNQTGFDVGVLGNHEFDFGTDVLHDRISQSQFPWILANVDATESVIDQPDPYVTLTVGGLRITFLGLVETNGKEGEIIPSTHPLRVSDLTFQPHEDVAGTYANLKSEENADLLIGLTHLGSGADRNLAENFEFFDLIIGGHSHERINTKVNGTPIVQAGANLQLLGKVDLFIEDQTLVSYAVNMIDLAAFSLSDAALDETIADYNNDPSFAEVVGQSDFNHQSFDIGCFYTTALQAYLEADFTIQNFGGIRAGIDEGPITRFEIFTMDPFNNQSVTITKTVGEFETFLCETGTRFFYSGLNFTEDEEFQILDDTGNPLPDDALLTLGVNDYIPAIFDEYFDPDETEYKGYTTAEAIIGYLQTINNTIDFEGCVQVVQCD